jgi:hypothetical protein
MSCQLVLFNALGNDGKKVGGYCQVINDDGFLIPAFLDVVNFLAQILVGCLVVDVGLMVINIRGKFLPVRWIGFPLAGKFIDALQ